MVIPKKIAITEKEIEMSDPTMYLIVNSTMIPGKMEQMQNYASQVTPLLLKGGGEMIARYGVVEQMNGEGGPKAIAVMKFPSGQAIKEALSTDEFKALSVLRDEAFSRVDQMICSAL